MKDPKDFPDKNPLVLKAADWLAIFGWWAGFAFAATNFMIKYKKLGQSPLAGMFASGELLLAALLVFLLGCIVGLSIRAVKRGAPLSYPIFSWKYPAAAIFVVLFLVGICNGQGAPR